MGESFVGLNFAEAEGGDALLAGDLQPYPLQGFFQLGEAGIGQPQHTGVVTAAQPPIGRWGIIQDNFDDLVGYLKTGKSAKYGSEAIIGRWDFNTAATTSKLLEARPVISSREMRTLRAWVSQSYAKTAFVAGADRQAFLKNLPHLKVQPGKPPVTETATWEGKWKGDGADYELSLSSGGKKQSMPAQVDGTRLTIKDDKNTLVFDRDEEATAARWFGNVVWLSFLTKTVCRSIHVNPLAKTA